jgi:putative transcriptional regulator
MFEDLMNGLDEVDAFLAGQTAGYKVSVPAEVDVKRIRKGLKMTQSRFSDTFGFSLDAVKHWEGGRRTPESSARAFLTVIAKNPGAVIEALHPRLRRRRHTTAAKETRTEATAQETASHLRRRPAEKRIRVSGKGATGQQRVAK